VRLPVAARRLAILVVWCLWTLSTMNLRDAMRSGSTAAAIAVFAGFILGNYTYAQLWMDEGRARERRRQRSP
jgi:hypothetical protein